MWTDRIEHFSWVIIQLIIIGILSIASGMINNTVSENCVSLAKLYAQRECVSGITYERVRDLYRQGQVQLIDVRSPEEFAKGHVLGAVNIPADRFYEHFLELVPVDSHTFDNVKLLVTYSDTQNGPHRDVANTLRQNGFNAQEFQGSWTTLKNKSGLPVVAQETFSPFFPGSQSLPPVDIELEPNLEGR